MPHTLLLQLVGPMQAWGHRSRFDNRDTGLEPTRSGVVGLLCAALGWQRDADLTPFEALKMGVRVDKPGHVALDYHTAQRDDGTTARREGNATVSSRYYLADARFLVGLEGDLEWLQRLETALKNPKWPLFLGRKSFPSALPVARGIEEGDVKTVLENAPWVALVEREKRRAASALSLKLVLETTEPADGEAILDVPRDFERRRYGVRYLTFDTAAPSIALWGEGANS